VLKALERSSPVNTLLKHVANTKRDYRLSCKCNSLGLHAQARSQKLNKEEPIPFSLFSLSLPSLPLRSRTPHWGLGKRSRFPSGSGRIPAAKRISALENASSDSIFGSFTRSCYMKYHRSYNEEAIALQCTAVYLGYYIHITMCASEQPRYRRIFSTFTLRV